MFPPSAPAQTKPPAPSRGKDRGQVEASARGHSDGSDHEERRRRGQARGEAARVQNGTRADEADARNDLRGDAGRVRRHAGQAGGKQREHGRAETDEHVRAQAGGAMFEFALQADDAAKNRRQDQTRLANCRQCRSPSRRAQDRVKCCQFMMRPPVPRRFRWPDFIIDAVPRCRVNLRDYRAR